MPTIARHISVLLLGLLLTACGMPLVSQAPQTTESALTPTTVATRVAVVPEPTVQTPAPAATQPPMQPTLVAAQPSTTPTTHVGPSAEPTASTASTLTSGQVVLKVEAGSAPGSVGVTPHASPNTFRVAADGSLRIMDSVNKRLLFYAQGTSGANGKLQKTIDLATLKQPGDFAVTTFGDVLVLDIEGWALAHYTMKGALQSVNPLHPSLKGLFSTISLTADGSLWGLGQGKHYSVIFDDPNSPADITKDAAFDGAVTARSAAFFSIGSDPERIGQSVLNISNVEGGTPIQYELGQLDGQVTFLDINQGMEPYVLVRTGSTSEVRRYSMHGELLGTLTLNQQSCRPIERSIYIDRPGDVYVMCVSDSGAVITRHTMTDSEGQALPLYDQLVTTAPWSPASLQAAPG